MPHTVYLSLGSNVGDRTAQIAEALRRLGQLGEVRQVSSLYETAPVEVTAQPWFLNAAAELITSLEPEKLIARLLEIERAMGRERTQPKGPRLIDLDILLFDDREIHTADLDIPHPSMHARKFVLVPLAEIAPNALVPPKRVTVAQMLGALQSTDEVHLFSSTSLNQD